MYNRQLKSIQVDLLTGRGAVCRADDRWASCSTWKTRCYRVTDASKARISKLSYKQDNITTFQFPATIFVEKNYN